MKMYFFCSDADRCYPLDNIKDMIRSSGESERVVFEAIKVKASDTVYCKHFGEIGDKEYCGKSCKSYTPRNGKSGNCKYAGQIYKHGKEVLVKVTRKELKLNEGIKSWT